MARQIKLNGRQKSAILMIALGRDIAAEVYKHMSEEEIEQLSLEIANVQQVSNEEKQEVLREFHDICIAQEYISQGGIQYAKDVLEKAYGEEKAIDVINRLTATLQVRPFDLARKSEPSQILNFIQNEHPQTIALVLSYLQPEQASTILSELPEEQQANIARRIALMESTSPEVLKQVEDVLEQKLSATFSHDYTSAGGIETVVQILNGVDRGTEKTILESLEIQDPELAEEVKKRMFVFEDIVNLDNRSIQRVIREVDNEDLQLALKVVSDEVRDVIFKNMSQRMAETFREEMEYMGPVRLKDVEDAQTRIVSTIRRLEELGEVIIVRGGDDLVV